MSTPETVKVGIIPAPPGWTLHYPNPDGGPDAVEPIGYWTVYSDGNARPAVAYQHDGTAGWIEAANEGVCHVVPPPDSASPEQEGDR